MLTQTEKRRANKVNDYNKLFYDSFCGEDYSNTELWERHFGNIADRIVEFFSPKTVLDAGCANGYLVKALRARGVDAYGVDISSYAIESADATLRPYLNVQSLTDPLPKSFPNKYDLVVTIEVLEHMQPEDGAVAIKRLCSYSDTVLFSSTPYDLDNKTHVNVQQAEYWAKIFAQNSYFRNLIQPTDFITPWAMLFHKMEDFPSVIFNYEISNRVDRLRINAPSKALATVYFDLGDGFGPDNMKELWYEGDRIESEPIAIPRGTRQIRIDPVEDAFCILSDVSFITSGGIIKPAFTNAALSMNSNLYFATTDAQLHYDVSKINSEWLRFNARIAAFDNLRAFSAISSLIDRANAADATEADLRSEIAIMTDAYRTAQQSADEFEAKGETLAAEINAYKQHSSNLLGMYNNISHSFWWRVTWPFRKLTGFLKWFFKKIPPIRLFVKFLKCLKQNGFKYTMRKVKEFFTKKKDNSRLKKPLYTEKELDEQRKTRFDKDIKFSILVPLYNTPEVYLKEMIDSVRAQTYSNWELCLADGSDDKHPEVERICKKLASHDSRIKYRRLDKNLGISGNTNACIEMATGDYVGLFDHDDLLHPAVLYEVMLAIEKQGADFIYTDENTFHKTPKDAYCPHFKPDFAPDTLRTNNYICHFSVFKKTLLDKVGGFRPECDGSQDYDMMLRLTEQAEKIVHIPKILYYWRAHSGSVATDVSAKPYVIEAAHKALSDHLKRVGLSGTVENTVVPSMYRIKYDILNEAKISIIIANKDHAKDLKKCIDSIIGKTTYKNYEIVIVENNSVEAATFAYYKQLSAYENIKIVTWSDGKGGFNYSAINNLGVRESDGDYVVLLNNDTEIISPDWLTEMLMFCQREDVGAVGAKLYYPDDTVQHAGIGIGILTLAGHYHRGFPRQHPGYMGRLIYAHNVSAVTAACIMVRRSVWEEIDGLDESFEVAFNDVDMCMRIRKAGYLIIMTPFAELYHYESKSRGLDEAPEKRRRFVGEVERFQRRWKDELAAGDPYYNPNFTLDREDFGVR